jgi:wyosine [tRNA(Phe)-imidazoG37] synthetase (radical SAM superfamily)
MNDLDDEVYKLKQVIDEIQPERIHLNTVIRPPAYSIAQPTSESRLKEIQGILGDRSEVIGIFKDTHSARIHESDSRTILALLKRRSMTIDQMIVSLEMKKEEIEGSLNQLLQGEFIKKFSFNGEEYFQAV